MSTPALKIYNTLTRTKEAFEPIDRNNVRMYVCGPTVYDYAHIGNARPLIVFDVLYRLLRHLYGESHVKYVRNITDVDDKINARAAQRGITIRELTEETNKVFQEDVRALGCLEPDVQPRATEHITQMIAIIERLIASGHAYAADGHVLFDVPSMPAYGRLSRRSLDEMLAGARVDVAPYKRGDMDFVLWKPSKEDEPGWESPWGRGRPGWHIECSAMSWKHLGETFDIHGGGIDLVFPHHENEIAQSCCAFGRDVMANYWMHNGFLQVEGEKMSKSLGNFVTIHELLHTEKFGGRKWPGEVLRLAMLRTHYRQPIDWTVKALEEAEKTLMRWRAYALRAAEAVPHAAFLEALADDVNTPDAVAQMHSLTHVGVIAGYSQLGEGRLAPPSEIAASAAKLRFCIGLLGLERILDTEWNKPPVDPDLERQIETLIADRLAARAAKNWAESDRIRDELAAMGIALKDNKDGTTSWEVKQ
ncbi:cysteine--tRNA ligase [Methylocystis iwaonis]|uniref:Cysteine--tRNA ligase n=1 Tax=Methylocystis iwaonis TaxID=2885079 RepID=A0ABM8E7W8_9HYPH|nr:cysteine--tRNA ligase [Methylocystis iwaonis]BDV34048.1 cysteine--tRNA ligase [Methylocystis iwaonis]